MATLIRLKQIESSSFLEQASAIGADFQQSVINIVQNEVVGFLPDGTVSSSAQITLLDASGYGAFTESLDITYATDYELAITSSIILDQGEF